MEINKDFLTLLTPEGEFLRASNHHKHYEIGQEIDFFPVVQEERRKLFLLDFLKSFKMKASFAVALLFFLVFAMLMPFSNDNEVYAYMSIDANPSIELGVNSKFQVIEMTPYNENGKQIIANLHNWKKKTIHVLTSEIVREMKEQGFIHNNHSVLLAAVSEKENELELNDRWKKEMVEIKNMINSEQLELKVVEGSKEERAIAKDKGLTTGQYKENQLKASQSTSQNKMESSSKSTKENKGDKQIPPGQANKNNHQSPGQDKKKESNHNQHSSNWKNGNNQNKNIEKKQKNNEKQKQQNYQENHQGNQQKGQGNNQNHQRNQQKGQGNNQKHQGNQQKGQGNGQKHQGNQQKGQGKDQNHQGNQQKGQGNQKKGQGNQKKYQDNQQ